MRLIVPPLPPNFPTSEKSKSNRYRKLLRKSAKVTLDIIPKKIISQVLKRHGTYLVTVAVLTRRQIQKLNHTYLGKNQPTDVLSFARPLTEVSLPGNTHDFGDVLICHAVAKTQARALGHTIEEELARLVVHGVLHLFGYDHEKSNAAAKKMFALQERCLSTFHTGGKAGVKSR